MQTKTHQFFKIAIIYFLGLSYTTLIAQSSSYSDESILQESDIWIFEKDEGAIRTDLFTKRMVNELNKISRAKSYSLFVVINPLSTEKLDECAFQYANFNLCSKGVSEGSHFVSMDFNQDELSIVSSISHVTSHRSAPPMVLNDSLFQFKEFIFFKKGLTKKEQRDVESYLAIKYGINITPNTDPDARSYTNISKYFWHEDTESPYNEYVLGVGSFPKLNLYQTSTKDAIKKDVKLYLDTIGYENISKPLIENSAQIIASKRNAIPFGARCTGIKDHPLYFWKFKLSNWSGEAAFLVLESLNNKVQSKEKSLELTNGIQKIELEIEIEGSVSRVRIPLKLLDPNNTYYLRPLSINDCFTKSWDVQIRGCDVVVLVSERDLLNTMQLISLDEGWVKKYTLTDHFTLKNLTKGEYRIQMLNDHTVYHDEYFVVEDGCAYTSSVVKEDFANYDPDDHSEIANQVFSNLDSYLTVYPNPIHVGDEVHFLLMNPQLGDYSITIVNSEGKIIDNKQIAVESRKYVLNYRFNKQGTYTVRFTGREKEYSNTIIVIQ